MSGERTYWRGTFNQWQLGLGGHINVQHYAQALDEARQAAATAHGVTPDLLRDAGQTVRPVVDRIDFRRELVPGDSVTLDGVVCRAAGGQALLNGAVQTCPGAVRAMRFETGFAVQTVESRETRDWPGSALPKADPLRAMRPMMDPWMPDHTPDDAWTTWYGTVEVRDCDRTGLQSPRGLYDIITRGLWAVHIRLGRHRDRMSATGTAGGVTAIQVRYGRPARMGDLLECRTVLLGIGANSLRMGHLIRDVTDGVTVARVEYVNTFFSRRTGSKSPPDADYLEGLLPIRLPG
ncbi:thioesterase family protein [Minwuia sp.]|uniref:thioesterase family protein n=1 Tax=Minwuia sp. TaxID=2493630 RepID=UPI003A93E63F